METKRLEVTAEGKKVYDIVIENNFNQLVKELSVFGITETLHRNRKAGCILLS